MSTKKTMVNKKPDESTIEATTGEVKKAPRKRKVKAAAVKVKASETTDKQAADKEPADKEPADKQAEEMFKSCEVDGASSEILGKAASHEEVAEPVTEATPEEVDRQPKRQKMSLTSVRLRMLMKRSSRLTMKPRQLLMVLSLLTSKTRISTSRQLKMILL